MSTHPDYLALYQLAQSRAAAAQTVECVWCEREFPRREMAYVPGTQILLCPECLRRYQGDEGEKE